jgi:hypothetical protein
VLPTVKFDLSGAQMTLAGPQYVAAPAALNQAPIVRVPAPAPAPAPEMVPAAPAMAAAQQAPVPEQPPAPSASSAPTVTTPLASALAAGYDDEPSLRGLADDPFVQDEQALPPPPDPDVVLPVPPPSARGDQRTRRWSRRHGA